MPDEILLNEVRRKIDEGAQIVEVLASDQYKKEHIPGAINIPLQEMDVHAVRHLDQTKPVVVYCYDYT
jgi:rhodanese-related sulfurtransferase